MHNFKDKNIIVTGGTRGIGAGISTLFLKAGAKVIATYARNDQAANLFKEQMSMYGDNLELAKFDVSSFDECQNFYNECENKGTDIHVLVNNSGIRKDNIMMLMPESDWNQVMNINLGGTFNMTKLALNSMLKNRYGRVINISSIGGSLGLPGQANYAASKAGQVALSKSLSKEVAKKNITINNVAPGFIETELISDLPAEQVKEYKKQVPMRRFGKTEDVANAVAFLASENASYITGTTLEVSGGL